MEAKLVTQAHTEPMASEIVSGSEGPQVERLTYGVSCKGVQYRTLSSRNQLIRTVVNPLIDMIMRSIEKDGGEIHGVTQRFTVNIVVTQERDIDTVQ
jgi:hypothetical protein